MVKHEQRRSIIQLSFGFLIFTDLGTSTYLLQIVFGYEEWFAIV